MERGSEAPDRERHLSPPPFHGPCARAVQSRRQKLLPWQVQSDQMTLLPKIHGRDRIECHIWNNHLCIFLCHMNVELSYRNSLA